MHLKVCGYNSTMYDCTRHTTCLASLPMGIPASVLRFANSEAKWMACHLQWPSVICMGTHLYRSICNHNMHVICWAGVFSSIIVTLGAGGGSHRP